MLHHDRRRAGSFGEDAEQYDRARPSYPRALVDELMADDPARVLDVGCGTGIGARLFAERGCDVLGVEPDPRMAVVARRRGLRVEQATFEGWEPRSRRFDLVTSAQAWHWVDPHQGATKAADVLRPGARVGLFWNYGLHPPELARSIDEVYTRIAPGLDEYSVLLGHAGQKRVDAAVDGLRGEGRFADVTVETFAHQIEYSTHGWLDQLPTHSDHRTLPPDTLQHLLDTLREVIEQHGGHFVMSFTTSLVTGVRRRD